ncbi:hypothetical protein GCM10009123_21810 [Kangiella japonica]|uniref:Lipocalin-like domain-containing protein n=2 Tax=Kangiella japonica TaxID=647384 RepID=A0ABP3CSG0_9GAMM
MKYRIGIILMVVSMVSSAQDDWYLGVWAIDTEKSKEQSKGLVGKEKDMADKLQKHRDDSLYEITEDYFRLYSFSMAVASPKFEYFTEENNDGTIKLQSLESSSETFDIGQDEHGVYLLITHFKYKKKDAMNYAYDEDGKLVIEEQNSIKAYLKEYDEEIDSEHFDKFIKEKRYK